MPARSLSLEENWSIDPASLNVGDSTTRTLTLNARGLQGSQLPPLSSVQGSLNIPELRFYPDQESIDQSELADGLQGRRVQSEALVARSGGAWTLPEIRVPWWNTDTDSLEFAVLPAREVKVAATQTADLTTIDAAAGKEATDIGEAPRWLWALGGAGWLTAIILGALLWRSRRPSGSQETGISATSDNAASQTADYG